MNSATHSDILNRRHFKHEPSEPGNFHQIGHTLENVTAFQRQGILRKTYL